ncbi:type I toxin-antitoxin system Ibs family toxin, partial [Escherichia coli]
KLVIILIVLLLVSFAAY